MGAGSGGHCRTGCPIFLTAASPKPEERPWGRRLLDGWTRVFPPVAETTRPTWMGGRVKGCITLRRLPQGPCTSPGEPASGPGPALDSAGIHSHSADIQAPMLCVSPSTLALSPRVPQGPTPAPGNLRLSCIPPQPGRTLTPLGLGVPRPVGAGSPLLPSLAAGTPAGTGRVPSCGESSWPGAGVQVAQRPRTGPFITREHGLQALPSPWPRLLECWCPEGAEALPCKPHRLGCVLGTGLQV